LEYYIDVGIDWTKDSTNLTRVLLSGQLELVRRIFRSGTELLPLPNVLTDAVRSGNVEVVKYLLSIGYHERQFSVPRWVREER
jgi:hypothetical protein